MTQVDFYILQSGSPGDRYAMACRLAGKAWQLGHRVYMHTNSEAESKHLDRMLWTYRQDSFVPHSMGETTESELNQVLIGHGEVMGNEHDVLLNLANEIPDFFSRFHRVAEFIDHDNEARIKGREHYSFYRDRGYPLKTHEI